MQAQDTLAKTNSNGLNVEVEPLTQTTTDKITWGISDEELFELLAQCSERATIENLAICQPFKVTTEIPEGRNYRYCSREGEWYEEWLTYDDLMARSVREKNMYLELMGEAIANDNMDLGMVYHRMWAHGKPNLRGNALTMGETKFIKKTVEAFFKCLDQEIPIKDFFNKLQPRKMVIDIVLNKFKGAEREPIGRIYDCILKVYMDELQKDIPHFKKHMMEVYIDNPYEYNLY